MVTLDVLVDRVRACTTRPFVLGIAGAPGSGKSTFVEALARRLADEHPDVVVSFAPMDGFHLRNAELERRGLRHLKGVPETFDAAGYAALLRTARRSDRDTVFAPAFDRSIEEPVDGALAIPAGPGLLLAEGNYLGLDAGDWPEVRAAIDELWFLDVPLSECAARCLQRRLGYGADEDTARHLVETVDAPNGEVVAATERSADLMLSPHVIRSLTPDEV